MSARYVWRSADELEPGDVIAQPGSVEGRVASVDQVAGGVRIVLEGGPAFRTSSDGNWRLRVGVR